MRLATLVIEIVTDTGSIGNPNFVRWSEKCIKIFVMLDERADDNDNLVVHVEELNDNRILNIVRRVEPML